jgi:hypothetical protein
MMFDREFSGHVGFDPGQSLKNARRAMPLILALVPA